MSEKIKYTDEPLGDLRVVPDFLPRPDELAFRDEDKDPDPNADPAHKSQSDH